jgi:uncharacterized membrane protein
MRRLRQLLSAGSLVLYPILVHTFIVKDAPVAALATLLAVALVMVLLHLWLGDRSRRWIWTGLYALLASAAVANLLLGGHIALFLPPLVFNSALAIAFAGTLRAGAVPLVEPFMRKYRGTSVSPAHVRFARALTWAWTVFFVAMAVCAGVLATFASLESWSLFANFLNYLFVGLMFVGQFAYAWFRFGPPPGHNRFATIFRIAGDTLAEARARGGAKK